MSESEIRERGRESARESEREGARERGEQKRKGRRERGREGRRGAESGSDCERGWRESEAVRRLQARHRVCFEFSDEIDAHPFPHVTVLLVHVSLASKFVLKKVNESDYLSLIFSQTL